MQNALLVVTGRLAYNSGNSKESIIQHGMNILSNRTLRVGISVEWNRASSFSIVPESSKSFDVSIYITSKQCYTTVVIKLITTHPNTSIQFSGFVSAAKLSL